MRCIPNDGLRFSFDNKDRLEDSSGSETPRFGEVETDSKHPRTIKSNKKRQTFDRGVDSQLRFSFQRKQNRSFHSQDSHNYPAQKGKIGTRLSELQVNKSGYPGQEENRSVRSVQSLKQRLANRSANKRMLEIKKRILSNNARSLASLLQQRKDALQQRLPKSTGRIIQDKSEIIKDRTLLQGSLRQTPRKSLPKEQERSIQLEKSQQTSKTSSKKEKLSQQSLNLLGGHRSEQKRSGRSFKTIFHRGKAVLQLQIEQGAKSNYKIDNISKAFEEFKETL